MVIFYFLGYNIVTNKFLLFQLVVDVTFTITVCSILVSFPRLERCKVWILK